MKKPRRATIVLRVPREVKTWLERQSAYSAASQNAEIIRCIHERMDRERIVREELARP